jgi:hypothetical protein
VKFALSKATPSIIGNKRNKFNQRETGKGEKQILIGQGVLETGKWKLEASQCQH